MMRSARLSFHRKVTTALVAAGSATAIFAGAQPAAAAVVTETVAVSNNAVTSVQATCPKGQRATGAGWSSTPPVANQIQVLVQEFRKLGQKGWILSVSRGDPNPANATTTLILYCLEWAPKTKEVVALTSSPDNYEAFDTADAVCPKGRTVQSGGFSIPVNPPSYSLFAELVESYRLTEDTWRVRMEGTPGTQLATYAYCAKRDAPTEVFGTAVYNQPNANLVPYPAASGGCPAKRKAVAGGLSQPDAVSNPMTSSWVFGFVEFLRNGKAWQTSAKHFGPSTTLNVYAYCAKKPD